jgi:hypothetical protein
MGTSRATGGAVAIAIFGSIIRNKTAANLAPNLAAAVIAAGLPSSQVQAFVGRHQHCERDRLDQSN